MNKEVCKTGFYCGLIAFIATMAFTIVQLLQLLGILSYPMDEILIYGTSLCIVIPFLLEMLALHYITAAEKKFWSHAALIFTVIYVIFVTANYVVQLATVIPKTVGGDAAVIDILRQTPHSLFWDFDAIGYIMMGLATLFAIRLFEKHGFQKRVRLVLLIHALVTPLIGFVYFYPHFSDTLLLLAIPWSITAPLSMLMIAIFFKKNLVTE